MAPRKRKPYQLAIDWIFAHVFAPLLAAMLHVFCWTYRWEIRGRQNLTPFWDEGNPVIVGCWHGRLMLIPYAWNKVGKGETYVLMGRNRNGELITRIVATFNMKAVRGGSTVGGKEARDELLEAAKKGGPVTLSFTPDGPRGPAFVSKMGMAHISRTLNIPVVWVTASASNAYRFKTWDRFLFPWPFSKVIVSFDAPIYPEQHAAKSLEDYKEAIDQVGRRRFLELETEMDSLTTEHEKAIAALGDAKRSQGV